MVAHIIPAILLHITHERPAIVGVCWTNDKVATKSLEQGVLWHIHPKTQKAIEHTPTLKVVAVHKKKNWCEIELDPHSTRNAISHLPVLSPSHVPETPTFTHHTTHADDTIQQRGYEFLETLQKVVEDRKACTSEGSYTTHLFKSGKEKIRKKLGEEAIETILATDTTALISESADLLYHLFVMLIYEGIDPTAIMDELYTRFINT